jgi:hypothetical protein
MAESQLAVYLKADQFMKLDQETQAILQAQIAQARATFNLESGREYLAASDFERATDSFTRANRFFNRTKLRATILGLRFAPRWTRLAVIARQKSLSPRTKISSSPI